MVKGTRTICPAEEFSVGVSKCILRSLHGFILCDFSIKKVRIDGSKLSGGRPELNIKRSFL